MRIALAQINPTLGDFSTNKKKILEYIAKAVDRRCELVVFPELSLFGYHPADLLERQSIVKEQSKHLKEIEKKIPKGIVAIIGAIRENPSKRGKPYFNSAAVIRKGLKTQFFDKELLPVYDVFDESRHIEQGHIERNIFKYKKKRVLITICEDIWGWPDEKGYSRYAMNPILKAKNKGVDLVVNLSASPFTLVKEKKRRQMVGNTVKALKAPFVYVNMVGAQDELIYDGGSFAVDKRGHLLCQSQSFCEDINVVDYDTMEGGRRKTPNRSIEKIRQALVLGLRDFLQKVGISRVHLGLSGGIDSAVVACLAVDAIGPSSVSCIGLPGPYSSDESLTLAKKLAENLGCHWHEFDINPSYKIFSETFDKKFSVDDFGLVHENLQARLRALALMAFSNAKESLLITTGNKSEYATGYSTLYGDMCGGLAPIGDLLKGQVFELASHYNSECELIPQRIIERPPTAELRPNQKDEDSLPKYKKLDASVKKLVEEAKSARGGIDHWVLNALMKTEFKRWQAPPILKVSSHAFGRGRRFPIAHRARC